MRNYNALLNHRTDAALLCPHFA